MGIERVKWAERERIELGDMQAMSDLATTNLAAVLAAGFQPSGVLRGGALTADGSFVCTLAPLCAIDPTIANGIIMIDTDQAVGPFAGNSDDGANPSHYDRIDLLSVQYAESVVVGDRTFINSDASTSDDPGAQVRIVSGFTLQITQGTYAASPVAPATPVGFVPVTTVRVPWGATGITQDNVAAVTTSRNATDPSIFYPRFHYAPFLNIAAFPFAHQLFILPPLPEQVVGHFTASLTLDVGSIINPGGEISLDVQGSGGTGMLVAQAIQAVPEPTIGDKMMAFALHGTIWPTATGSTYYLNLRRLVSGVEHTGSTLGSVAIAFLRATVTFHPTIAPWPGKTVA